MYSVPMYCEAMSNLEVSKAQKKLTKCGCIPIGSTQSAREQSSLVPMQALFIFCFERAWYAKIRHVASLWTSVGVSMEMPPFTMTSFQSAYGQVVA